MGGAKFTGGGGGGALTVALILDTSALMEVAWPEFTECLLCVGSRVGAWDRAGTRPGPHPPHSRWLCDGEAPRRLGWYPT